jgi:hypothetical protein
MIGSGNMRRGVLVATVSLVLGVAALSALPASGQSAETTVTATLRIAAACLTVSPTAVDFGTLELTPPDLAARASATPPATATVTLRNCAAQPETVLVKGGPATGAGVNWALAPTADVCAGPNLFIQGVRDLSRGERRLTANEQPLKSLAPGAGEPVMLTLVPPCAGSTGAGQSITVKYTFTATFTER